MYRYALHVDHARKTGTLKKRTARSKSQSSSRGGTPEGNNTRFNPRAVGTFVTLLKIDGQDNGGFFRKASRSSVKLCENFMQLRKMELSIGMRSGTSTGLYLAESLPSTHFL